MRLSGTYLTRLIYLFFPLSFIAGVVILFFKDAATAIQSFSVLIVILWVLDSSFIRIWFHPRSLIAENGQIRYGESYVDYSQIESIEIVSGRYLPVLWLFYTMIEIKLVTSETVYAIPKTISFQDMFKLNLTAAAEVIWSVFPLRDKLILPDLVRRKLREKSLTDEINDQMGR